jgi:hypothetical protein
MINGDILSKSEQTLLRHKCLLKTQHNGKQLTKNYRHLCQSPEHATQNRNTTKELIKAKNLLAVSFYKPVQQSAAHGNKRWLNTPPSQQPNTILNPKAETGIFVYEMHTHRSSVDCSLQLNEMVPRLSGRKLGRWWG